jgi:8-oxo-dGTP diphosphatase
MTVEVAAAVIERGDGAFLLAQRPAGKVYDGWWEFPGGKVEPGESAPAARARELHEELGIDATRMYPWITRIYSYEHATVRLNFFRVTQWRGEPHSRENQRIVWQRPGAPLVEPMLPANAPVLAALALPLEYAVTNAAELGVPRMLSLLEARLQRGLRLVQVREPALSETERDAFTAQVLRLAQLHDCRVMVKRRFAGAAGVHFTASQLRTLRERPAAQLAAASCHTREELELAMALGLDFVVLGPVMRTASHEGLPAMGWARFEEVARGASLPVYAIGGMSSADLERARQAGAHGIAMIRGAWQG